MDFRTARTGAPWTCPSCGRIFARANQAHSCQTHTVESHLETGGAEVREAFDRLQATVEEVGPFRRSPVKTQINFAAATTFMAVKVRPDHLLVELLLPRRVDDKRFERVQTLSPGSHAHVLRLASADDVDEQLREWLGEAYAVGARAGRRSVHL